MSLDALAAAALADDLGALAGARVQRVVAVDARTLSFELYAGQRHHLTLSAAPDHPGIALAAAPARRGAGAGGPLALACRARLEGARLTGVSQPPYERILRFDWQAAAPLTLVAELTGRLANLILVDADGAVIAAAHRVVAEQTRARTIQPGRPYAPPPTPPRPPAATATAADLAAWLAARPDAPAWRCLVDAARGLGPQSAREAVHRAAGDAEAPARRTDAEALRRALAELTAPLATHAWTPTVAWRRGVPEDVVACAPYALSHRAGDDVEVTPAASTLEAVSRWHAARAGGDGYGAARAAVGRQLAEAAGRAARRRAALERALAAADPDAVEALKLAGDLILGFQWQVRPGDTTLVAPTEPPTPIALDPSRTPVENAQAYFDRYRRARRAAARVPDQLARARAAEATLAQLGADLALAENRAEIDAVQEALEGSGLAPAARRGAASRRRAAPSSPTGRPRRYASSDGLTIVVGRNSRQNETVTFTVAARGDPWLHARGVPGAHVVVKAAGGPVPARTIDEAAALAAWFSAARDAAAVDVAVTDARHVRRLAGGGPGMVTLAHDTTRTVRPASPSALGLAEVEG